MYKYRIAIFLFFCVFSSNALSFGLKTHIFIAQQVLEEIKISCKLEILDNKYTVDEKTCNAIKHHEYSFLSGALGPDIYPDLVVGQTTTHPGVPHHWKTDDWLKHFLSNAKSEKELAFAYGVLVHASSDIFAHTYVNAYTGDIFELTDEQAVERRHFTLEKYIDKHLPSFSLDTSKLAIPTTYLRNTLLFNSTALKQYAYTSHTTGHLITMGSIESTVNKLNKQLKNIELHLNEESSNVLEEINKFLYEIRLLEPLIKSGIDTSVVLSNVLIDLNKEVRRLENIINNNKGKTRESLLSIDEKINDIRTGSLTKLNDNLSKFEQDKEKIDSAIKQINNKIKGEAKNIKKEVCKDRDCSTAFWPKACELLNETVCKTVTVSNKIYDRLSKEISENKGKLDIIKKSIEIVKNKISKEKIRINDFSSDKSVLVSSLNVLNKPIEASLSAAKKGLEKKQTELSSVIKDLDQWRKDLKLYENGKEGKEEYQRKLEKYIGKNSPKLLSSLTSSWLKNINKSADEYINTSLKISRGMLGGDVEKPVELYSEWYNCYGQVFLAIPIEILNTQCKIQKNIDRYKEKIEEFINDNLLPEELKNLQEELKVTYENIKQEGKSMGINMSKFIGLNTTLDFIDIISNPDIIDEKKLNSVFLDNTNSNGKKLLTFSKVSDLINKDMNIKNGKLSKNDFKALAYAIKLSKISLLSVDGINEMISKIGNISDSNKKYKKTNKKFSPLLNWVGSLDGNHQWGIYGIPYVHESGFYRKENPWPRKYGLLGENKGFKLFQDKTLRENVFLKIFPEPVGGEVVSLPKYVKDQPFPATVDNPFPVTFNTNGDPIVCNKSLEKNCFPIGQQCKLEALFFNQSKKTYNVLLSKQNLNVVKSDSDKGKGLISIKNTGNFDAEVELKGIDVPAKWKKLNVGESFVGFVDLQQIKCKKSQSLSRSLSAQMQEDINNSVEALSDGAKELFDNFKMILDGGATTYSGENVCNDNSPSFYNKYNGSKNKFSNLVVDKEFHAINNYLMMQAAGKTYYGQIRYKGRLAQSPEEFRCGAQELYHHWGFDDVQFVDTKFSSNAVVAIRDDIALITIRGTQGPYMQHKNTLQITDEFKSIIDIAVNAKSNLALPDKFGIYNHNVGKVHSGYATAAKLLATEISKIRGLRDKKVFVTGHSLGGATAIMLSYFLKEKHKIEPTATYAFASPEIGDEKFSRSLYKAQPFYMTINYRDPIPNVGRYPIPNKVVTNIRNIVPNLNLSSALYGSRYTTFFDKKHNAVVFKKSYPSVKRRNKIKEIQEFNIDAKKHPVAFVRDGLISSEWHYHHPNFYISNTYKVIKDLKAKRGTGLLPEYLEGKMCIRNTNTDKNRKKCIAKGNDNCRLIKTNIDWYSSTKVLLSDSQGYPFVSCK